MFYNTKNRPIRLLPSKSDFFAERDIPKILKLKKDGGVFDKIVGFEELYQTRTEKRSECISGKINFLAGHYDTKNIPQDTYYLRDAIEFANKIAEKDLFRENNTSVLIFTKEKWQGTLIAVVRIRKWRGELSVEFEGTTPGICWSPGVGVMCFSE